MKNKPFRVIDPIATGKNILRLRKARGLSVRDLQAYFGFEEPQAIYKWQRGQSLPTVDHLYALSALLDVSMDEILVQTSPKSNHSSCEQQAKATCCSPLFQANWAWQIAHQLYRLPLSYSSRRPLSLNRWFHFPSLQIHTLPPLKLKNYMIYKNALPPGRALGRYRLTAEAYDNTDRFIFIVTYFLQQSKKIIRMFDFYGNVSRKPTAPDEVGAVGFHYCRSCSTWPMSASSRMDCRSSDPMVRTSPKLTQA